MHSIARNLAVEMALGDRARGRRLAKIRERAHMSQEQAALASGVSLRSYQAWEAGGNIRPENRKNVAKALSTTVEEIMGTAETPNPFRVAEHIDQRIEAVVLEFRGHVDRMLDRTAVSGESVQKLLDKQTDILEQIQRLLDVQSALLERIEASQSRIEEFVETLPADAATGRLLAGLSGEDPSSERAQLAPVEERPSTPGSEEAAGQ